nr:hypothetical protein Iba_chr10eCG8950 [Ipomoea batatas]
MEFCVLRVSSVRALCSTTGEVSLSSSPPSSPADKATKRSNASEELLRIVKFHPDEELMSPAKRPIARNLHHPRRDLWLRLRCGGFGGNDRQLSFAATDFFVVILTAKIGDNKASTGARLATEHD